MPHAKKPRPSGPELAQFKGNQECLGISKWLPECAERVEVTLPARPVSGIQVNLNHGDALQSREPLPSPLASLSSSLPALRSLELHNLLLWKGSGVEGGDSELPW